MGVKSKKPWRRRNPNAPAFKPYELEQAIDDYMTKCAKKNKPLTMQGLANTIGIERHTLTNYVKRDDELGFIASDARAFIAQDIEEQARQGKNISGNRLIIDDYLNIKTHVEISTIDDFEF